MHPAVRSTGNLAFAAIAWSFSGCQTAPDPPAEGISAGVFRGQSPTAAVASPWGPTYLAPGELSCDTPPPIGLGYQILIPQPAVASQTAAPTAASQLEPGFFDVLPPEGGPISDDFGLPTAPEILDRVANPLYVRVSNADAAWEEIARITSRYFPLLREERVRSQGAVLTEGRIETRWAPGSTIFEPWRRDSAGAFNRWQSTLQTIRRRAIVRVVPAAGGYELGVRVDKQLEDLNRPERASAGAASLRNDAALPTDRVTPIDPIRESDRWVDLGRDEGLEQRILRQLQARFAAGS